MIQGFLHAENGKIVDGSGKDIILKGWGLGNWLVQEGYMWQADSERFDRPARIEKTVEELTGTAYAQKFWTQYRDTYIRREDIMKMAERGYNSVRIPFHYKHFLTDEGFRLLDRCIDWCEEAGIYAFLDMHAAPGGQTGSNIDDSVDNVPRLFLEEENQKTCIAVWRSIAEHYRDRECVGGYDLLNEPIVPAYAGFGDFDELIPRLVDFYERLVAAIREVDTKHLLSIEGAHWATDVSVFDRKYDENMVLHFHRYGEIPDIACLQKYIDAGAKLGVPLWLGETGENVNEWYAALYPLAERLGIGYNLWTWKKMDCTNSPYSIHRPKEYQKILDYLKGGEHPGEEKAQEIFNEYLHHIQIENCQENLAVTNHVFRSIPFSLRATDFDSDIPCRDYLGTKIVETEPEREKKFCFDCCWDRYGVRLGAGESVAYQIHAKEDFVLEITFAEGYQGGSLMVGASNGELQKAKVDAQTKKVSLDVCAVDGTLRIEVTEGEICLVKLDCKRKNK